MTGIQAENFSQKRFLDIKKMQQYTISGGSFSLKPKISFID